MSDEIPPDPEAEEEPEVNAPTIFLSYSHDNKEHKQWVGAFAQQLVTQGIQVLFDRWDLDPGDNFAKFMERAVTEADRVLMVCTEEYVRKADDGKGGVGYEAMIVTGELVKDLGTKKFIPIIRQGGGDYVVPKCVSTRLFVNLSDGEQYDEELERLIRELHKTPDFTKPALGKNPFTGESFEGPTAIAKRADLQSSYGDVLDEPATTYNAAIQIIRDEDSLAWRKLLRAAEARSNSNLKKWKHDSKNAAPSFTGNDLAPLFEHAMQGVEAYSPIIACLLAAAESAEPGFASQISWIDAILQPDGWETQEGTVYWIEFPDVLLCITHTLVGAIHMEVGGGENAVRIASERVSNKYDSQERKAIYQRTNLTGWPRSLNRRCTTTWTFLDQVIDQWTWLHDIFGSVRKCRVAITSYYLFLNFLNFVKVSKDGRIEKNDLEWAVAVPLMFSVWGSQICDEGYQLFLQNRNLLKEICLANELGDVDKLEKHWGVWIDANGKWMGNVFKGGYYRDLGFPHKNFPHDLRMEGNTLEL